MEFRPVSGMIAGNRRNHYGKTTASQSHPPLSSRRLPLPPFAASRHWENSLNSLMFIPIWESLFDSAKIRPALGWSYGTSIQHWHNFTPRHDFHSGRTRTCGARILGVSSLPPKTDQPIAPQADCRSSAHVTCFANL